MRTLLDWLGALLLAVAPFIIDSDIGKGFAIIGLALLTLQAIRNSLYNLILLNALGIVGYTWSLFI